MILFVTEQYAGAEYLAPLLLRWQVESPVPWVLVAKGASVACWMKSGITPLIPEGDHDLWLRRHWATWNPTVVVGSASKDGRLERAVVEMAQRHGVPSAQFIDMWTGYRARFETEHGKLFLPDFLLAIDERCAQEMGEAGLPGERTVVLGQPGWEAAVDAAMLGRDEMTQILLVSQPISRYYGLSLGYDEHTYIATVLDGLSRSKSSQCVSLVMHPEQEIPDVGFGGFAFDSVTRGDGHRQLARAHTVLGMFSTLLVIAYFTGRSVASVQPRHASGDLCPLSRWGLIPCLRTGEQVAEFVDADRSAGLHAERSLLLSGSLGRLEQFCISLARGDFVARR